MKPFEKMDYAGASAIIVVNSELKRQGIPAKIKKTAGARYWISGGPFLVDTLIESGRWCSTSPTHILGVVIKRLAAYNIVLDDIYIRDKKEKAAAEEAYANSPEGIAKQKVQDRESAIGNAREDFRSGLYDSDEYDDYSDEFEAELVALLRGEIVKHRVYLKLHREHEAQSQRERDAYSEKLRNEQLASDLANGEKND